MIRVENPLGDIEISEDYFSQLIGNVVPSCYGVVGMANGNTIQGLRSFFNRRQKFVDQGVTVRSDGEGLIINLHIIISYGVNISAIVGNIVDKVSYTLEEVTDLKVKKVNVYVDSMISE